MGTLLVLALLGAADPEPETARASLGLSLDLSYTPVGAAHAVAGHGAAAATFYFHPLVDDDAPLSLQPFLQRSSTAQVAFELGGFTTSISGFDLKTDRTFASSASVDAYLGRNVILAAGFGLAQHQVAVSEPVSSLTTRTTYTLLDLGVGVGLRFGDLRVDLSYRFQPLSQDGQWAYTWGRVFATARWVVMRRVSFTVGAHTIQGGGGGSLGVSVYPKRILALSLAGAYERGRVFLDSSDTHDRGSVSIGLTWWLAPRVALSLGLQSIITSGDERGRTTTYEEVGSAGLVLRLP